LRYIISRRSLLILVISALLAACERRHSQQSRVSLSLPSTSQNKSLVSNLTSMDPTWGLSAPTDFSQVNCWMIAVAALDLNRGSCTNDSQATLMSPGIIAGPFPGGSMISLDVPKGPQRNIYLMGLRIASGELCIPGILSQPILSPPVIVGQVSTDLVNAEESVTINASFTNAQVVKDCSWTSFGYSVTTRLPKASIAVTTVPGGETGTVVLAVTLDEPPLQPVTIIWNSESGTAVAGQDFVASSGTASFAIGETLQSISVPLIDDASVEGTETFLVRLTSATGATLESASASASISDDDGASLSAPTLLSLTTPASSPGNVADPIVTVQGVAAGDTVTLYRDSGCATQVGIATSIGTSVDITAVSLSPDSYTFYARRTNGATSSTCSTANVTYLLDTSLPSVTISSAAPTYVNAPFSVTFTFSEPVMGFALGDIDLSNATVSSLNTSDNIIYTATVSPISQSSVSVSLSASVVNDAAGNGNSASTTLTRTFDNQGPTVTNVTSSDSNGTYNASQTVTIQIVFNEIVNLIGSLQITLNSGATVIYSSGSGSTVLNFVYTVQAGQNSSDLDYTSTGSLTIVSGTLRDDAENDANLSMAPPGSGGSLGANKNIVISAPLSLSVLPVHPTYGANWNDYVKYDEPNLKPYEQTDENCSASETGYYGEPNGCVHGGEMRKVVVTGFGSCTGLSITDSLGAFEWICDASSGMATFYSVKLKQGKGLRDLITSGGAWQNNSVTVLQSAMTIGTSSPTAWWSNSITALPINAGALSDLNASGTIYYANADTTSLGYKITAPKIAVVTLSSYKLQSTGVSTNNFNADDCYSGSVAAAQMICAGSVNHLWIEATVNGTNGTWPLVSGIRLNASKYSRIHGSAVFDLKNNSNNMAAYEIESCDLVMVDESIAKGVGKQGGMRLSGSKNIIRIFDVARNTDTTSSAQSLMVLTGSATYNRLQDIRLSYQQAGTTSFGLKILGSNNVVTGLTITNINANSGLAIQGVSNTIVVGATISGTGDAGILLDGTTAFSGTILSHITTTNNTWNGIYITGGLSTTYAHSIVMVNQDQAIQSPVGGSGSGNIYHDIVAANNAGGIAVNLAGSQASSFTGFLNVGPGAPTCGGGGLSGSCSGPLTSSFALALCRKGYDQRYDQFERRSWNCNIRDLSRLARLSKSFQGMGNRECCGLPLECSYWCLYHCNLSHLGLAHPEWRSHPQCQWQWIDHERYVHFWKRMSGVRRRQPNNHSEWQNLP
jgi:hypothetical protein